MHSRYYASGGWPLDLEAFVLRFECRALDRIITPAFKGSMARGALFSVLRRDFCLDRQAPRCSSCQARQAVCGETVRELMAERASGIDLPLLLALYARKLVMGVEVR